MFDQPLTVRVRGIERPLQELLSQAAARRALGHLMYIGWYDVTGSCIAAETLPTIAARVRTESVIDYVSFASAELLAAPPPERAMQLRHAEITLIGGTLTQVGQLLTLGVFDVFLHHEQLLSAAKLAIRYGQGGRARHDEDMSTIGTLLLAVNDALLDTQPDMELDEAGKRVIRALVARRAAFRSNEQAPHVIGRYFDLLFRRPVAARTAGRIVLDFRERFQTGAGLSIEEFLALSHLSTIPFLRRPRTAPDATSANPPPDADVGVPWDLIGDILRDITDADYYTELRDRLSQGRQDWIQDLSSPAVDIEHLERLALYRHPMYRREDGSIVPINVGVAAENMSLGAYWTLHSACAGLDRVHGVNDVTSDMGALFEDYIDALLHRAYQGSSARVLHREHRERWRDPADSGSFLDSYERTPGQLVDPTDAVVVEPGGLVLLEATVRNIPVATLVGSVPGTFEDYLSRITDKFRQIGDVARDIGEGRLLIPGVDATRPWEVFPVVILLHPFPQHYVTWEALEADVTSRRLLELTSSWLTMQPPQLVTAEEMEMLEPHLHAGFSLVELLRDKVGSRQYQHRTVKDFLLQEKKLPELPNHELTRLYGEAFDVVKTLIQPHLEAPWDAQGDTSPVG